MFLERTLQLIEERNLSKNRLLLDLDLSKNSFINWEKRGSSPSADTVQKIASYFNVSVDYLLGKTDDPRTSAQILKDSVNNQKARLVEHGGDGVQFIDKITREEYERYFPQSAKKCILSNGAETIELTKDEYDKLKSILFTIRK